jgi:murein DD-endopeptidase MepM/ murein hydrolase activator NlpD
VTGRLAAGGVAALLALLAVAGGGAGAAMVTGSLEPAGVAGGGSGAFVAPLPGAAITQRFGCTALAIEPPSRLCPGGHFHSGVDLAAAQGTPVRVTLAGVTHVVVSATGYGLHVIVDHGNGLSSLYAHLSAVAVADGETVQAGQVIGAVGSTGNSTGPHLHFEIRRDGLPEDPALDVQLG